MKKKKLSLNKSIIEKLGEDRLTELEKEQLKGGRSPTIPTYGCPPPPPPPASLTG